MSTCAELQAKLDGYLLAKEKMATGRFVNRIADGEMSLSYADGSGKDLDWLINDIRARMSRMGCAGCPGPRRMISQIPLG